MKDYSRFTENLNISYDDHILRVALNNPPMNCNTDTLHKALTQIWEDINDDDDVNVVIFTGEGRAFSAGGDVKAMQYTIDNPHTWWKTVSEAKRIIFRMLECEKPVIARVNGHAVGFGATLALASDIIVSVDTALFGDPHVKAGLVAGDGGALLWPQAIGFPRAKEALLLGELIPAKEAAAMGLINHAVPADQLDEKVNEIADKLNRGAPRSIRWTKQVINLQLRQIAQPAMDLGMATETLSMFEEEHVEAVKAFTEKRDPVFKKD
jgi:enoyl-CoA hydratase